MPRGFGLLGGIGILLLALGCRERMPNLKPPPQQVREEFFLPPVDDARYNKYVEYPPETLHQDPFTLMKKKTQPIKKPGGARPGSFGLR